MQLHTGVCSLRLWGRGRGHGEVAGQENGPGAAAVLALAAARLGAALRERAAVLSSLCAVRCLCARVARAAQLASVGGVYFAKGELLLFCMDAAAKVKGPA